MEILLKHATTPFKFNASIPLSLSQSTSLLSQIPFPVTLISIMWPKQGGKMKSLKEASWETEWVVRIGDQEWSDYVLCCDNRNNSRTFLQISHLDRNKTKQKVNR